MSYEFDEDGSLVKMQKGDPARAAGERIKEFERLQSAKKYEKFGLCRKCRHFQAVTRMRGAYSEVRGYCQMLPDALTGGILREDTPIVDCGAYWPIGAPTLQEMLAQAKMLEKRDGVKGYL